MQIIKSIKIRKFRSLKSITSGLETTHLNILVGQNDQGKSNVLRALSLFFNGQTDPGKFFRFKDDYCFISNTGRGTSKEVRIDLEILPPRGRFKDDSPVIWIKRWKQDGSVIEERKYKDSGEELSARNNVSKWLDKLRYRYVPAIKGQDYFSSLMGELHDVINEAHSAALSVNSEDFIDGIRNVTSDITTDLNREIGLASTIQVPSDFRQLFSNLDFGQKIGENVYHLRQRGDGVKTRHIPIILKYMAEQEKNISRAGFVKPDTIWGFEEPENNLELTYAFELAKAFKDYSNDIQIFLTTHSPAFYALDKTDSDGSHTYHVFQVEDSSTKVKRVMHDDEDYIHEKMGLLPIITPYLEKILAKENIITELQKQLDEKKISDNTKCIVLTEDEDHEHVKHYFEFNGFINSETEYFSYKGADRIEGAIVLAEYLMEKNSSLKICIHRDRDYLNETEVQKIRDKVVKKGFHFFVTEYVDIESAFLNIKHVSSVCNTLDITQVETVINQATDECRESSLARLTDHVMKQGRPEDNAYYKKIKELESMYDDDKIRFRYGKKVFNLVKSKIQKITKSNVNLFVDSEYIKSDDLMRISNEFRE